MQETSLATRRDFTVGLNQKIATGFDYRLGDQVDVLCECGGIDCDTWITLTYARYDDLRRMESCHVVVNGHELPEVDRVTVRHESFAFVEPIDLA